MNEPKKDMYSRPRRNDEEVTKKRAPRWTIAFLRALERCGDVRASAEDAGIDHSTAYARRRAHVEFAADWERALAAHAARVEAERAGDVASVSNVTPPPTPPHRGEGSRGASDSGEGSVLAAAQVKRAGHGRWSERKEKLFFAELAATANVKRAAAAAGVSPNAVYQRRMRDRHFKAKWAAVLETGRAAIEMKLVEAANRTFEPDELDVGDVQPKVSVAEAIRIVQVHGSKAQQEQLPDPFAERAASMTEDEVNEIRENIIRKLRRTRERDMPDMIAAGWSLDEEYDRMVPPGWVRG